MKPSTTGPSTSVQGRAHSVSSAPQQAMSELFAASWKHFRTVDRHVDGLVPEAYRMFSDEYDLRERDEFGRAAHFAALLERVFECRRTELPACFLDVVRFDLAVAYAWTLGFAAGCSERPASRGQRYATVRGLSLQHFEHDVCELAAGTRIHALVRTPCLIAFVPGQGVEQVRALRLDAVREAMVRRAVPSASVDDLVTEAAFASYTGEGRPGFRAQCEQAIHALESAGVLIAS